MCNIATTVVGLEDFAAEEIKSLGGTVLNIKNGMIKYRANEENIKKINSKSRFLELNIKILGEGPVSKPKDLRSILSTEMTGKKIKIFANKPPYPRKEIETELSKLRIDGNGMIYVWIDGDQMIVGKDIAGRKLNDRNYRVFRHPAALNPIIANAMLSISGWRSAMVDPFCGSGTIPIEAYFSRAYSENRIYCVEIKKRYVEGAKLNAKMAGANIVIMRGDALNLHRIANDAKYITTNPPFGLRVGTKKNVYGLYEKFAEELEEHFSGSYFTVLSISDKFENYFDVIECKDIMYGALKSKICKMKI